MFIEASGASCLCQLSSTTCIAGQLQSNPILHSFITFFVCFRSSEYWRAVIMDMPCAKEKCWLSSVLISKLQTGCPQLRLLDTPENNIMPYYAKWHHHINKNVLLRICFRYLYQINTLEITSISAIMQTEIHISIIIITEVGFFDYHVYSSAGPHCYSNIQRL